MAELNISDINEIFELFDKSNFAEMRLEMGDTKIELRRNGASNSLATLTPQENISVKAVLPLQQIAVGEGTLVPAPMLGIFYHAPKPGDDAFVKIGDIVTPDTVIGIIEVMKLMTRVNAGISGVVTQIIAPSGELVEHGDALIRVKVA
jgi:acetyl-CoA carboxylase biotin carboxyl carrier protein